MTVVWKGPYGRRELAHQFGAATMDRVQLHWDCAHCRQPVDDPDFYSIGTADYRTFDQLIASSRQALGLAGFARRPCPTCGQQASLRAADYHTYQQEADRDFVLRWTPDATTPSLWFWDDAGYRPTSTMLDDDYDEDFFEDETAMRRAATRASVEGIEAALPDVEAAAFACDGWWEMLDLVPPLAEIGRDDLARDIVVAYLQSHFYEDVDGSDVEKVRYAHARALLAALDSDDT